MSKQQLNKTYIFFKNLYRPGEITPPKDKRLTIVHKGIVSYVLKGRKIKDIPATISYFEWDHVKSKFKFRMSVTGWLLSPIVCWYLIIAPIRRHQDSLMEKWEKKKYGESRENDKTFSRWF